MLDDHAIANFHNNMTFVSFNIDNQGLFCEIKSKNVVFLNIQNFFQMKNFRDIFISDMESQENCF